MAVTKIWAIHDSVTRVVEYCSNPDKTKLTDLEQVLLYAANKDKTLDEGEQSYAVTGINCNAETAAQEMTATQRRFGKAGGNVAYHAYQSFKTGEVSAAQCHEIGLETARRLWGDKYQVLVATHFNTGTYHNHFVLNSVGMWDGKKLEAKFGIYYSLRNMSDRICAERGLTVVQNPQRHKTARSVYFAEKNGEPTRFNLMREALDKALTMASSWRELATVMRKMGYILDGDPYRKYVTIRSLNSKKSVRTFRLGDGYDKESLRERLVDNQYDRQVMQRYYAFLAPYRRDYAEYSPPTETYFRKREFYSKALHVTGYLSLWRCIAIVLGLEPLYEKEYQKPLSPECREACRKLDRFTAEVDLVCREQFETPQDIQGYIARMNQEIDIATALRSKVRNQQRRCTDPAKMNELKKKCKAYTSVLAELRKNKKTAYNIIEDNPKVRELLECEYEARLEADPYVPEKEKRPIRQPSAPQRKEKSYER
jgi:hypothetical protein